MAVIDLAKQAIRERVWARLEAAEVVVPGVAGYIDLIVMGSVAVNDRGTRLGKGAGYADLEVGLLADAGLLSDRTVIATTVHELQVPEDDLPEMAHDLRVDVIVTPRRVIWCGSPRRPAGVDWSILRPEQIAAIPVLARRART